MKAALFIIDLQKAFYNEHTKKSMDSACEYINAAIPLFRKQNLPIIWIQHKEVEDNVIPGQNGFEFIDALQPEEEDYRVIKEYGNSFNKTDCLKILKDHDIDTVIITGFCAEYCVLSTYRGAQDLDLFPIILRNSLASDNDDHIRFVENISNIMSYGVLKKVL